MSLFAQCFWDSNLSTSQGFEILTEHINKNFEILSTIINLIEHKVSSDDLHGRAQSKIAKAYMKPDKSTKNDEIIRRIADRVEKEANERILQCDKMKTEIIDRLKEFMKVTYDKFKKAKIECSKSNKERKLAFDNAQRCVKSLNSKIKAHETLNRKLSALDDEKNRAKITKSLAGVKVAEKDMLTAILNLNLSIETWKTSLEAFCNISEEIDLSQNSSIKTSLGNLSTILTDFSRAFITIQEEFGDLSTELNPKMIIEQFAKDKKTNESLPAAVFTTQKAESGIIEYSLDYAFNLSDVKQHVPFANPSNNDSNRVSSNNASIKYTENESHTTVDSYQLGNDSFSKPPTSLSAISGYVIAQYDYEAQADDELTFTNGDRIKIIYQEDESWYMGELSNGAQGIFPITYVIPE